MDLEDDITPERRRLDSEWVALNALRETIAIANRGVADSSYAQALAVGQQLAPRLFDPEFSVVASAQEPPLVQEYRQRAEAYSALGPEPVSPVTLLDHDIAEYERLLEAPGGGRGQLSRAVAARVRARGWLEERAFSETKLIERDVFIAARPDLPRQESGDGYVGYSLPFERALRIRLLHPDKPEHATGADLVYEFCDQGMHRARLAFVQYKIWDGHQLRFANAKNLDAQLTRLTRVSCERGLCSCSDPQEPPGSYRLPYCAAFLRPTDRLQRPDATLISSGLHVPVCIARTVSLATTGGRILRRDPIRGRAVSQRLFEELFNRGMLGSRWLSYDEVETLYREHSILEVGQRILVHAQEFAL